MVRLAPKTAVLHFWLSVLVAVTWRRFYRARHGRKSQICRLNFDVVCHSSKDISISGFSSHFRHLSPEDTSSSTWSKTLVLPVEFRCYLTYFQTTIHYKFPVLVASLLFPVVRRCRIYFWKERACRG